MKKQDTSPLSSVLPSGGILPAAAVFLFAMLLIGSFFDYPLSRALYNESNLFGRLWAAFGEFPAPLGAAAAGAMLLYARDEAHRRAGRWQLAAGCVLIAVGGLAATGFVIAHLDVSLWAAFLIGCGSAGGAAVGMYLLCRGNDRSTVLRVAAAFLLTIGGILAVIHLVKIPWGRPRMRLVANDARAYFKPWWQPGRELRNALTAVGIPGEEFKSFPSAHTADSSSTMLVLLLPLLRPALARRQKLLFAGAFAWTCSVALSRIIMGAHYLTDTAVGFAVGLTVLTVVCHFLYPAQKAVLPDGALRSEGM